MMCHTGNKLFCNYKSQNISDSLPDIQVEMFPIVCYLCAPGYRQVFMKTKTLKKDKVNIITLGCSKNLVDSEVLSGQLQANDIDVVHENKRSDHNIVVVNTC